MRVLHVNDYSTHGGAEVSVALTCEHLQQRGIEVELFTIDNVDANRFRPWHYISNRAAKKALWKRLVDFSPDVVHLHNIYHRLSPAVLETIARWRKRSRRASVRVLLTAHDHHLICPNPLLRQRVQGRWRIAEPGDRLRTVQLLSAAWDHRGRHYSLLRAIQWIWNYRLFNRRSIIDVVLCPSRYMSRQIAASGIPVCYVPNPVLPGIRQPVKPEGKIELVFAGRVQPEKGLAEFIEAMPHGDGLHLSVVGSGTELAKCKAIAERRSISDAITFHGHLSHDRAIEAIASANVLVLPSVCLENAPSVMFEALAHRTNLLVSNFGGMKEIVKESGVGYCFDPDDPETLREQFNKIESAHRQGCLNSFDPSPFLEDRSADRHVDRLLELYADR